MTAAPIGAGRSDRSARSPAGLRVDRGQARRPSLAAPRGAWPAFACSFLALACSALGGCAAPPSRAPLGERVETVEESTFAPADLVLLEELRGAWADGDRVLVRRLIERIRGGSTDRRVLEAAEDYRRRLEGLEISERLSLGLRAGAAEGDPSRTVVELIAENADPRPVTVNLLTPTLERRLVSISPLGLESRRRSDDVLPEFEALVVPGEGRASVTLGDYPRASGGIASRERYSLDPAGAWLSLDGELLPVEDLPIASDSRTGIAPFLPSVPVEPSVLIAYLDDAGGRDLPDEVFLPALLERAVRIHPTRREEAVALLDERRIEGGQDRRTTVAIDASNDRK